MNALRVIAVFRRILAQFRRDPRSVALDSAGNVYVSDFVNNRIRRIDNTAAAGVTTLAAGVAFHTPAALTIGADDNELFVADNDSVIQALDVDGENGGLFELVGTVVRTFSSGTTAPSPARWPCRRTTCCTVRRAE